MKPMYCPKCLNDTLKLASSGVVKITFNGKAKSTSQFFYDLKREPSKDIYKKFMNVVDDYFSWYATLNNKDPIVDVKMFASDFRCENRCPIGAGVQLSVVNLVIPKEIILDTLQMHADKYEIQLNIKSL